MAKNKEESNKSFEDIIKEKYGAGTVFKLSDTEVDKYNVENFFNTGSMNLNEIISGDHKCGIPKGRVIEIYGPEGVGKSTLALHISAEANKKGYEVAYQDTEHGLDINYALEIGVKPDLFYLAQPDVGEDAFELAHDFIRKGIKLIIFDSVVSIVPRAEIEGSMDDKHMGAHARLMGQGLRKLIPALGKNKTTAIFINQVRMNIGNYGNPEVTPGGKALKFYSFIRLEIRAPRSGKIVGKGTLDFIDKNMETGTEVKITTKKNKQFIPQRNCVLNIIYGKGIDKEDDLVRFLESRKILKIESK